MRFGPPMPTMHNETYTFQRDAPPEARAALSAPPKKTLFNIGVEFRRFITAENRKNQRPWQSDFP
jgi:hypothetical protein